jgi:DNA polymerase-3 subunit alpha (Gram-positive type)
MESNNNNNFFDSNEVEEKEKFVLNDNIIFIVGDVETTGLSPAKGDRMTEIALLKVDHEFNILDKLISFINPEREISAMITKLTGITEEMVADAQIYYDFVPTLYHWWHDEITEGKQIVFVAHNAPFDIGFINHATNQELNKDIIVDSIDTVSLARELYPFWKNHKLATCAEKFDIVNEQHHRAENDTMVLLDITKRLVTEYIREGQNPINFRTKKNLHYKKV